MDLGKERVLPSSGRLVPEKYRSFIEPQTQEPQHIERVFQRMMSKRTFTDRMSRWTNRYLVGQTEQAFQTWSVAFYAQSTRVLMVFVVVFHLAITLIDFFLTPSIGAYLAKYGYTEIVQWIYLVVVVPLLLLQPHSMKSKQFLFYFRQWKWIISLAMVLLCAGLMVRTGCIYEVNLQNLQTKISNSFQPLSAVNFTTTQEIILSNVFNEVEVTLTNALEWYGDLVVAGDTILIFVTQIVVSASHCDLVHSAIVWFILIFVLLGNILYWHVAPNNEAYIYFVMSSLLSFLITRELDISHRTNFLHYYNAEKSAEILREQLDQALELIIFEDCKVEEKEAVAITIDQNTELSVKLEPYRIPLEKLTLKRVIGQGAFGEVILGEFYGTSVVLKRMHRHRITTSAIKEFTDEILLMCQLRHPNIVQFIGASWNTYSNIGFILEYVGQGDLYLCIHDKRIPKSWSDPFHRIAVDAARGVSYLHSKNIIHRDLKSSNILISSTYTAKICDLGMSKTMEELKSNEKQVGTPLWTAPEVVTGGRFSLKSDVYAFGIILTELITRKTPYAEKTKTMSAYKIMLEVAASGLRPALPTWLPEELRHLIVSCLAADPSERPEMLQVLSCLQTDAIYQLEGRAMWEKVRGLVHERAHRTTSFSMEMIRMAKAQHELESYAKPHAMDSDSDDDDPIQHIPVIETAVVEEW